MQPTSRKKSKPAQPAQLRRKLAPRGFELSLLAVAAHPMTHESDPLSAVA